MLILVVGMAGTRLPRATVRLVCTTPGTGSRTAMICK